MPRGLKESELSPQRSIHEKYLTVEWTPAKRDLLRELYHVSPVVQKF
jgi:hypothetical protein